MRRRNTTQGTRGAGAAISCAEAEAGLISARPQTRVEWPAHASLLFMAELVPADADDDAVFMRAALDEARAALACGEVAVGCIFVDGPTRAIVARAHNRTTRDMNVGSRICASTVVFASRHSLLSRRLNLGPRLTQATRHAELVAVDAWVAAHGSAGGLAGTTLCVSAG